MGTRKHLANQRRDAAATMGASRTYTPVDVSVPLVVTAARRVSGAGQGIVCDLATVTKLDRMLPKGNMRLFTLFGMLPNFEPEVILPKLAAWVRKQDWLLFSANLTPAGGIEKVLPQYANELTEDWLRALLEDFGVREGRIEWAIREGIGRRSAGRAREAGKPDHVKRGKGLRYDSISADFVLAKAETLEGVEFRAGEKLRLFFSLRYTPEELRKLFARHGLQIQREWITASREEGVFLCRK